MDLHIQHPVSAIHLPANYHRMQFGKHLISYFNANDHHRSYEEKNFSISGGEWIDYFAMGWFVFNKESLEIQTEIQKNPSKRYELNLGGGGWYAPNFVLEVTMNGNPLKRISYAPKELNEIGKPIDITEYVQNGSNTIGIHVVEGEFVLAKFEILEKS